MCKLVSLLFAFFGINVSNSYLHIRRYQFVLGFFFLRKHLKIIKI